jgi:hypothetical protein
MLYICMHAQQVLSNIHIWPYGRHWQYGRCMQLQPACTRFILMCMQLLQAMHQGEGFERGQKATAAGLAAASLVKVLGPQQVCMCTSPL